MAYWRIAIIVTSRALATMPAQRAWRIYSVGKFGRFLTITELNKSRTMRVNLVMYRLSFWNRKLVTEQIDRLSCCSVEETIPSPSSSSLSSSSIWSSFYYHHYHHYFNHCHWLSLSLPNHFIVIFLMIRIILIVSLSLVSSLTSLYHH